MEGPDDAEAYDQTFIEQPAILDKYKAAAVICDSKLFFQSVLSKWIQNLNWFASTTIVFI